LFAVNYECGTINITPVIVGFGNFPFGFAPTDAVINGSTINVFKATNNFVVSDVEKMAGGYSAELGYFFADNYQIKTRVSFLQDRGLSLSPPAFPRRYGFNTRNSWAFSLGVDRYVTKKSEHWAPFVGLMGGFVFQEATSAVVYNISTNGGVIGTLGNATLQSAKRRFKASLELGTDYRFNKRWALGITSGLSFMERPAESYKSIFNIQTSYRDNNKSLTIPFYVSIRNLIP
jgi:hypothetical protein